MARLLRPLLVFALALAGCSSGAVQPPPPPHDAGPGDSGPDEVDSGPVLHQPDIADSLGAHSGAYDVNGGGRLLVIELDGRIALEVSDQQDLFIGGIDAGRFSAETVFADQETCGPVTLVGAFDGGSYAATKNFCADTTPVSGPIAGSRLDAPAVYRQNLAWSGAYDAVETPASGNGCALFAGSHPLTIGVARDRDGGGTTAFLFGDTVKEELVFGSVDDASGILSANAVNLAGQATDTFTLFFIADGGVSGTRTIDLGSAGAPCTAQVQLFGAKR